MGEWLHILIEGFFLLVLWLAVWSIQRDIRKAWRKYKESKQ